MDPQFFSELLDQLLRREVLELSKVSTLKDYFGLVHVLRCHLAHRFQEPIVVFNAEICPRNVCDSLRF